MILFAVIQAVPYGRAHSNPPVQQEPLWDSPQTRQLAVAGCFDCHSNETTWPWDSNIAPFSWLIEHDVSSGRGVLNFSEWSRPQVETDEIYEVILGGGMPPWYYKLMHPAAKLSQSERERLVAGLKVTFEKSPPVPGGRRGD